MVYVCWSPGGSYSNADGPWRYCGVGEALIIIRMLSDALIVVLCWLRQTSNRCTS
jgi:hypothetical protein